MSNVFPRHTKSSLPTAVSGEGCYLIDSQGKRYFDGSGGAAVSCLGHSDAEIIEAIKQQASKLSFAHTGFFTSEPAEELAELLIANAPDGIDRVFFNNGGSEAVESAIKLARQYYLEIGQEERCHLIARKQSFHGNTLGALAAGGNEWRRKPFAPLMINTSHISPCYTYRDRCDDENEFEYGQRVANELEAQILEIGPQKVMGFIAETVSGATLGAVPAVKGYFKRIREICDTYGVLLILDEVMCGMGRTGTLFASEQEEIVPDIITIAKGLGAGYAPIGAMLCSSKIYNAFEQGSGFFQHSHTYMGHSLACATGKAVVSAILNRGLLNNVVEKGEQLKSALVSHFGQHPNIGDIRGRGLFIGLEFVQDRDSKQPFSSSIGLNKKLKQAAMDAGLICYPMGGTIDGVNGDHILLAPPFIIDDNHIDEIVEKLDIAIGHSIQSKV
ncbi:MAG: aspartate aminotransferase family protein [Hyphomicrobiales bacterium]|nr:aspartate aminotransferase family protein [Hyphomicrobiales bacterium]